MIAAAPSHATKNLESVGIRARICASIPARSHAPSYTQSEEIIFSRIRTAFPDHKLIGEESNADGGSLSDAPTWMCGELQYSQTISL